jgi:hypothetical protein
MSRESEQQREEDPMGVVLDHIDEGELVDLNDRFYGVLRLFDLQGVDLDAAVGAALTGALGIIEMSRKREAERRERIRLVE